MKINERIKARRLELGISADELARQIGKNRATVYRYENTDIENMPLTVLEPIAKALKTTPAALMGWDIPAEKKKGRFLVPVYARIPAGIPLEAIDEIIDYEEISEDMARNGEYLAMRVTGTSMEPKISEGDVVIIRWQPTVENGQIAAVLVNGSDATLKKFYRYGDKVTLVSLNPSFPDMEIDLKDEPVSILGRLVELRAKF